MVLGSLFSFLSSTPDILREDEDNPRALFARADLRSINRQRRQLISNFGFEDTISDGKDRVIPDRTPPAFSKKRQEKIDKAARKTLIGVSDVG